MALTPNEASYLFDMAKYPCDSATIEFPMQGQYIVVELQDQTRRIKFQSDINRANKRDDKMTLQLRHHVNCVLRRLDLNGHHTNPPGTAPNELFVGYEEYVFNREDHVHFYIEGYGEKWALPLCRLPEIDIRSTDTMYEKMLKFFVYCNVKNMAVKVVPNLFS